MLTTFKTMSDEQPAIPGATPKVKGLDPGELLARGLNTVQPSEGATGWTPPAPEELARLLPQYRIEALIGHGGMGAVYKGRQPALERAVAIKLLPAEVASDGQFIARFHREARTLARLQHSGIVSVYDFGQTGEGNPYFVMEYVDGTDLQRILRGPGLESGQALELIGQICEALHYAHRQGVVHRDIKPANILVTQDGRAKLADFGLARPLNESGGTLTERRVVMGTPDYMAPEQRDGHADHRADIYALGVMLYEMLTGERPHGIFEPPSHRVRIDVRLDEVVIKALQHEPDRRYQQASEMKTDVDIIRTTPPPLAPRLDGKAKPVSKGFLALIALAGIALFGIASYLVWPHLAAALTPRGETPNGWYRTGATPQAYDMSVDRTVAHSGKASATLKSIAKPAGFGALMQSFDASSFRGKRVRMSGYLRSKDVDRWAGMLMRVDGPESSGSLAFDNMQNRPIRGTTAWTRCAIVLDVPDEAVAIAFGAMLIGSGQIWMDDLQFEIVGKDTATTSDNKTVNGPRNLDFKE